MHKTKCALLLNNDEKKDVCACICDGQWRIPETLFGSQTKMYNGMRIVWQNQTGNSIIHQLSFHDFLNQITVTITITTTNWKNKWQFFFIKLNYSYNNIMLSDKLTVNNYSQ